MTTYRVLTSEELDRYRDVLPRAYGANVAVIGDLLATIDVLTTERDALLKVTRAASSYMGCMLLDTANWEEHTALRAALDALSDEMWDRLEAAS